MLARNLLRQAIGANPAAMPAVLAGFEAAFENRLAGLTARAEALVFARQYRGGGRGSGGRGGFGCRHGRHVHFTGEIMGLPDSAKEAVREVALLLPK